MRALVRLLIPFVVLLFGGAASVWADPDVKVFGPQTYSRTGAAPDTYRDRFSLPAGVVGPYRVQIQNGNPDGSQRVSSATVTVNGIRIAGPNDFNQQVGLIARAVALAPNNTVEVTVAGGPVGRVAITFLGTLPKSVPVSVAPNPLSITAGATGQVSIALSPAPREPGSLALTVATPGIASLPATVAYEAGQAEVRAPVTGVSPGSTMFSAVANGGNVSGTIQVSPALPTITSSLPSMLTLTQGASGALTLTISVAQPADVRIDLTSSDAGIVAVPSSLVLPAGAGSGDLRLSAIAPGTAQVVARLNGSVVSSQVTVTPAPPIVVSLLPTTNTVTLGASASLLLTLSSAQITPTDVVIGVSPEGAVTAPSKITVPAGQVSVPLVLTASNIGTAGVTASLNGSSASAAVQVVPPAPAVVSLLPSPLAMTQDATAALTVTLNAQQLANTEVRLATDHAALLRVPDSVVVPSGQVSASFTVTALAVGSATITAGIDGRGQSAVVSVAPYPAVPVSLLPDPLPLQQGASGSLILTINAAQLADTAMPIVNSASAIIQAPTQIVVPAGQLSVALPVTALVPGEATLIVEHNGTSTQAAVHVTLPPPVPSTIDPAQISLPKGVPGQMTVTVSRAPAVSAVLALTSSDPLVAEVPRNITIAAGALSATFPVLSRSEGRATISASLNGSSVASVVTVTAPELTALSLSPLQPTAYTGETVAFLLQGTYSDATQQDVSAQAAWTHSDPNVISLTSGGVATALAPGSSTVSASFGKLSASTTVNVDEVPFLAVSLPTARLRVDEAQTLSIVSTAATGNEGLGVSLNYAGTGSINGPSSVLIKAGQRSATATLVGVTPGEVTITASAPRRVSSSAQTTVVPKMIIESVLPLAGPVGIPVVVKGLHFDPNAAGNEVRFNGERAVVAAANADELRVIVPVKASTGLVTVATTQGTASSSQPFTVQLQQDFDLTLLPAAVQAALGGRASLRVRLDSTGLLPYAHAAVLSANGIPAGVTLGVDRPSIYAKGESTLLLNVPTSAPPGIYSLTVSAAGPTENGMLARSKTLRFEVLPAGTTTVSGRVVHAEDDSPFGGARVRLGDKDTFTDAAGYYRFVAPGLLGDQVLKIDGHTAATATTEYPSAIAVPIVIVAGQDNVALTSYIQGIDVSKFSTIVPGTATAVTTSEIPNYALNIPNGAILFGWDGTPVTKVNVRTVSPDRLPIKPLPSGVETRSVYLYYFFREGGANPTQPIPVTMANDIGAVPGQKIEMWYYDESVNPDPNSNQWKVMGLGTVTADGKSVVSDPGVGIPKFCCGATFIRLPPPFANGAPSGGGAGGKGGDAGSPGSSFGPGSRGPGGWGSGGWGSGGWGPGGSGPGGSGPGGSGPGGSGPGGSGPGGGGPGGGGPGGGSGGNGSGSSGDPLPQPQTCDPVDLATGNNLAFQMRGFGINSLLPVNLNCQYRSTNPVIGTFGRGASFSYDWIAVPLGDTIQVNSPDGVTYVLAKEADGAYRSRTGRAGALGWEARTTASGRTLRSKTGEEMDFNSKGHLVEQRDTSGNKLWFLRDTYGFLTSIIDASGNTYTFTNTPFEVDGSGYWFRDPNGTRTIFIVPPVTYMLTTGITDPLGRSIGFTYDSQMRMTSHTDAAGNATLYEFDSANRISKKTDPLGRIIRFTYDSAGRTLSEILQDGSVVRYGYNADDLGSGFFELTEDGVAAPGAPASSNSGTVVTSTTYIDANGHPTRYRFNGQGYVTRITDALGRVTTQILDNATNQVKSVTDPAGRTTRYTYDARGNVTRITDVVGQATQIDYHPVFNKPVRVTNALGDFSTYEYDAAGRLSLATDPLGATVETTYTVKGQVASLTDPLGRVVQFDYDTSGNLIRTTDPLGQIVHRRYDEANRLIGIIDSLGNTSAFEYDVLDRVTRLTDALGGTIQLAYDADDRVLSVTDPKGVLIEQKLYDLRGRLTTRTDAAGQATTYRYDAVGNLLERTDRNGRRMQTVYDAISRPVEVRDADGRVTRYDYDLAGNVAAIRDSQSGDLLMSYDELNRLTRVVSDQGTLDYQYDVLGRRTQRTVNGADPVDYGWDKAGRLISLDYRGKRSTWQYDRAGRLEEKVLPNGQKQTYTWDAGDRLTDIVISDAAGAVLESVGYTYDAAGRRTARSATVAGGPETPIEASYDSGNRLTSLTLAGQSYSLSYDANGNLTQKSAANGTSTTYTWDARNQLTRIDGPAGSASFKYDALGRRSERTVGGDRVGYLYDGQNAIAELRNHAISANILTGLALDEVIARYTAEGERTLLTDALGSVILATKEDGTVQTAYGYSPYGETQVLGTDEKNASQYTGRENDGTGLYYYRARYYDPQLKRFISEDPIGLAGGINTYAYVEGNPISYADPLGLSKTSGWFPGENGSSGVSGVGGVGGSVCPPINVTKSGVALPPGSNHQIPQSYVQNPHRSGSYGEVVNGKFKERLRIDPPTPPGQKGPNYSHYHLDGKGTHYSPRPGDKDPGF